ncbi:MAG: hypothetical protein IJD99_10900 [Clostridia bacterium]|nr:hypothetical protein [Clostridia bacterium]
MKKLCAFLLMALLMVPVRAGADDLVLPDPGYYFGREYNGYVIWFEEYPIAEYEAYVGLLTGKYGMEITDAGEYTNGKECCLYSPGVEALVCCFSESNGVFGLEIVIEGDVTLEPLDRYNQRPAPASREIAWDDGRMIADPGDFLGYEIQCIEYLDKTKAITMGYYSYKYEAIPVEDILRFADAINASSFFDRNGDGIEGRNYWLFCHDYTGSDPNLNAACAEGRSELRRRKSDLSIYIVDPYADKSMFYIYEYPGFTVNSKLNSEREDHDQAGDSCSFCGGDGKCDECGGDNWVWAWEWVYVDGAPRQEQVNQLCKGVYCNGGSCSKCGGDGVR